MNERIRELIVKHFGLQLYYEGQAGQIEKFAELIVRECIQAIQNESMALNVDEFEHGLRIAEGAILDHFGVEK